MARVPALSRTLSETLRSKASTLPIWTGRPALPFGTKQLSARGPRRKSHRPGVPKQPLPGQLKPDAKGRCPPRQIAINGACWGKVDVPPDGCHGNTYVHQGGCYVPMFTRVPVPTSAPREP
jgi:hypothetical protein